MRAPTSYLPVVPYLSVDLPHDRVQALAILCELRTQLDVDSLAYAILHAAAAHVTLSIVSEAKYQQAVMRRDYNRPSTVEEERE